MDVTPRRSRRVEENAKKPAGFYAKFNEKGNDSVQEEDTDTLKTKKTSLKWGKNEIFDVEVRKVVYNFSCQI